MFTPHVNELVRQGQNYPLHTRQRELVIASLMVRPVVPAQPTGPRANT